MYEKLVSHKLSVLRKCYYLHAAQFAYRKGLGYTDALLTISHHLHEYLDARMESYMVQLYFIAAFDRVRHCGLLFQFTFLGVGGIVLSICREFLSDRRQRALANGATSEWILIVSSMPQGSVLGPIKFILYASEMDSPAVAASLNSDMARIQGLYNH